MPGGKIERAIVSIKPQFRLFYDELSRLKFSNFLRTISKESQSVKFDTKRQFLVKSEQKILFLKKLQYFKYSYHERFNKIQIENEKYFPEAFHALLCSLKD